MTEHTILMKWQHSVWIYNLQEQNTFGGTAFFVEILNVSFLFFKGFFSVRSKQAEVS